jgi:hypothetical protein
MDAPQQPQQQRSRETLWSVALPFADKQLAAEITRAALAYLRRKP